MAVVRCTIPPLRDRHSHPLLYAALMDAVDLNRPGESRESALERIRAVAAAGNSAWTIATGWNSGRFALDKSDFDGLPPIVILSLSIHGLIVNDAGRQVIRDHDETVAAHLDDQDWIERNLRKVLNLFARAGASPQRLAKFFEHLRALGVHSAEEMLLVGEDEIELFDEAGLAGRTQFWAAPETYDSASPANRERIHGIKLFTDGAIGVTTAALHEKYRTADHNGMLLYSDTALEALIARYSGQMPMAIHAIGDAAIDQVVCAVERAALHVPSRQTIRIEHAQFISESTARRAKALGLHLSMQPNFSEDSVTYADRLPAGYPARNNPFRMLIDRVGFVPGVDLYLGSDGMPHGVQEALRQSLFPDGGYEGQVLAIDEFIAGYCHSETTHGSIEIEIDPINRSVFLRTPAFKSGTHAGSKDPASRTY
ncbi:MAG TPA: amidohydrolase family protein [Vicinamibacterales bacterium]|nr:amidohydrolase family protein [Vicinamibacterales bacterium]